MNFKRVLGFVLLFAFIGYMGKKFLDGTSHLQDSMQIGFFLVLVVLFLVMIVRKIMVY